MRFSRVSFRLKNIQVSGEKELEYNCLCNKNRFVEVGLDSLIHFPFILFGVSSQSANTKSSVLWCLVFPEETAIDFSLLNTHKCSSEPLSTLNPTCKR